MTGVLKALSEALVQTAAAAGQSVVRVEGRRRLPASGVAWSADGLVVTANHVVERDDGLRVGLPDGGAVNAKLVGRDPRIDLAVLRLESNNLTVPAWAETHALEVGMLVLALGRPGLKILATLGILSALDEGWHTPAGGQVSHFMQTDLVMYPGFSGGPLVEAEGRAAGIVSSQLVPGLSLAIPTPTIRQTVDSLLAHGRVRRGYLGTMTQIARLPAGLREQLGQETGLLLIGVEPDGPADRARLLQGDMLVMLDGQPVRSLNDLFAVLSGDRIGATVPARVVRGGQVRDLPVAIGERPS